VITLIYRRRQSLLWSIQRACTRSDRWKYQLQRSLPWLVYEENHVMPVWTQTCLTKTGLGGYFPG